MKMSIKPIMTLAVVMMISSQTMKAQLNYPVAEKDATVDEYFGTRVADPYRWLENDTSEATARWVAAENEVTNGWFDKIPFRGKLLKRLKQLADYEKIGTPFKRHGRYYIYRNDGLQNQSVLYTMDRLMANSVFFSIPTSCLMTERWL